jgi:nucleoside-diphosphate kinase
MLTHIAHNGRPSAAGSEGAPVERTLILVKPDAMQRGLAFEVLRRLEQRGLKVAALRLLQVDEAMAKRHYGEHEGKPFFQGLVDYITSSPIIAAVFEGTDAVAAARQTLGATRPTEAAPGTIRGDFGLEIGRNLVHGSDSPESAEREIGIFFEGQPVTEWKRDTDAWVFE